MKTGLTKTGKDSRHTSAAKQLQQSVLAFALLLFCQYIYAGNFLLVNSGSGDIYKQFTRSLTEHLSQDDPGNILVTASLDQFNNNTDTYLSGNYTEIISTGIEAAIALSRYNFKSHIIMAMMPRLSYLKLNKSGKINCPDSYCRVVFLDQPVKRQLRLIKLAFPDRHAISIIGSQRSIRLVSRIQKTAKQFNFRINRIIVNSQDALISALNQDLGNTDILMTIPDPVIYNRDTARAILLASFNQRIPLFAYSRSFVRAGAVIGIYSTPEQIARHVAELIARPNKKNNSDAARIYPKYFSIDTNRRAAQALNITLPNTNDLMKRLETNEKN